MASFENFDLWYIGNYPYNVIRCVYKTITSSGLIEIGIAEHDSVCIHVSRFNEEYYDELIEKLNTLIKHGGGEYYIEEPNCTLQFERIWKSEVKE